MVKTQPTFPIPLGLHTLVEEICELYNSATATKIQEGLEFLIAQLKQPAPSESEIEKDYADIKSWEDLLNFKVYIDTEIYSPNEPPPEILPPPVIVVAHQEATNAYADSWTEIAAKLHELPQTNQLYTTNEVAKILGCSPAKLRRSHGANRCPIETDRFILDCVTKEKGKLRWSLQPKTI